VTTDRLAITAATAQDACDIARRQWERDGLRVVRFVKPFWRDAEGRWVIRAVVELRR
jgi:hypothetical protein